MPLAFVIWQGFGAGRSGGGAVMLAGGVTAAGGPGGLRPAGGPDGLRPAGGRGSALPVFDDIVAGETTLLRYTAKD